MPINWGSVFSTIVDVTTAVGIEAMKISVIDNAVEQCRHLSAENLVVGFTTEVIQMDDEVWSAWHRRLSYLAHNNDQTAAFMLQIGNHTRQEMQIVPQLASFQFEDAISIAIERMRDQSAYEQLCFLAIVTSMGKTNLKMDMIAKRIMRLLSSG